MMADLTAGELLTVWGRWVRGGGPRGYRSPIDYQVRGDLPLSQDDLERIEQILLKIAPPRSAERAVLLTYYATSSRPSIRKTADRLAQQFGLQWSPATVARKLTACRKAFELEARYASKR